MAEDVFLANEADWAFALRLEEQYERRDFRGLLEHYYELTPEVAAGLKARQVEHIVSAQGRSRQWIDALGAIGTGPWLDLGCGTGSFLCAQGRDHPSIGGVDIAMRWLLVARKRLEEEGLESIPLACSCAEGLPLGDAAVSAIIAGDVIEHVGDRSALLAEAFRVLRPGGRLVLASPNRYSLAPEPHVQVWGVGYLPRRWMPSYVRWMRNVDFRAIYTLGYGEWTRLLRASPFGGGTIVVPPLPSAEVRSFGPVKRAGVWLYHTALKTGAGRWVARRVGPLFQVVCEKSGSSPRRTPSSRATPRRSRP
ncbi:MAG: hypothetical protein NVSMB9_05610 [Isosphaeraceae bacterium]